MVQNRPFLFDFGNAPQRPQFTSPNTQSGSPAMAKVTFPWKTRFRPQNGPQTARCWSKPNTLRPLLKRTNPTTLWLFRLLWSVFGFNWHKHAVFHTSTGFPHSFRVKKRVFHEKITLGTRACLPSVFSDVISSDFQRLPKWYKNGRFCTL